MNRPIGAESVILMTDYLNSVSIPVIVTVVYVIIDLVKTTIAPYTTLSARLSHFYPLIALALGIVTAAVMYYAGPESITQTNLLVAQPRPAAPAPALQSSLPAPLLPPLEPLRDDGVEKVALAGD